MECHNNKKSFFSIIKSKMTKEINKATGIKVNKKIVLVGNPNVGKSVLFNSLTGAYVTVSNYPGTTVEIATGYLETDRERFEIIDTPGMYSMLPITEEERVTRKLLLEQKLDLVVHVVDAKNLQRMLPLTFQLIEAGLEVVLVLNIMDEAKDVGMNIDIKKLEGMLNIPVISTTAAMNKGIDNLKILIERKTKDAA